VVGRCDARCHEAKNPDCHCICGGAYHGVGSAAAIEDRLDLSDQEILSDFPAGAGLCVFRKPEQLELF
jgi:hypothetical protein